MSARSLFAAEGGEDVVLSPYPPFPLYRRAFAAPDSPPLSALEAMPLPHGSLGQVQPKNGDLGRGEAEETWLKMSISEIKHPFNFTASSQVA